MTKPLDGRSAGRGRRYPGEILIVGSAIAWSLAGLFTRLVDADLGAILFWRGVFAAGFTFVYVSRLEADGARGALRRLGRPGWAAAAVGGFATVCFIAALRHTDVANVVLIHAAAPLVAALLGWLVLRERPGQSTLVASVIALAGVAVIVGGSVSTRGFGGDILAVLMTIGMAVMTVIIRRHPTTPMVAAMALSSLQVAIAGALITDTLMVTPADFACLALFGLAQAVGVTLYTEGARRTPAALTMLLSTLDVALAPIWVLIVFAESPTMVTVLGGALVAAAVIGRIAVEKRSMLRRQQGGPVS